MNIGNRRVWLITDRHINHKNIISFCDRPEDYVDQMHKAWTKKVAPEDLVIDLGDVIFKNASELGDINEALPGTKILIMGNHDKHSYTWYMDRGYSFVCDGFKWGDIYFSHHPLQQLPEGCKWNIHGHLHNNPYDNPYDYFVKQDWHVLYALEYDGYEPIDLYEFLDSKGI